MGHTWKNWSIFEKWVILGKMGHISKHRHAKRARVIRVFVDKSIRRTVHSNDLVKFFWVGMYSKKETGNL